MPSIAEWTKSQHQAILPVYRGSAAALDICLAAILCRGNLLIEDSPGTGKTVLGTALAKSLGISWARLQCTPDLLPSDVIGVSVFNPSTGAFSFRQGPVFNHILLVDEINRATPRTQSALLEVMAEQQVSVEGKAIRLPEPFFVIATQSPSTGDGTFPLPEVQKDRFLFTMTLGYPDEETERHIMRANKGIATSLESMTSSTNLAEVQAMQEAVVQVHVDDKIKEYIVKLIQNTRNDQRLMAGVSPRGSLALHKGAQAMAAIRGRDYVVPEDVKDIAQPVLEKRLLIKPEYANRGLTSQTFISELLGNQSIPGYPE